jgi:PIN domain nuclease of toxin-antitoxin system
MQASSALGTGSRAIIEEARRSDRVVVSTMTFWEIAMLIAKGRLVLAQPLPSWRRRVLESGIGEVPVSGPIGIAAGQLPDMHGDPCDRIVVATAIEEGATLVTADLRLLEWPGNLPRHDART